MKQTQRIFLLSASAIIAVGAALRLYFFFVNRSLWLDEAMLALNLVRRSPAELLLPLDYAQGAPLGFLYAQKLILMLAGSSEYALRLLPLAAGLAALLLTYWQYRRYGARPTALFALALFALAYFLIYYASEAKQYSVDVLFTSLIYLAGRDLLEPAPSGRALARFAAITALALGFSHPAVFVVAGFFAVSGIVAILRRQWRELGRLLLAALPPTAVFLALYFLAFRQLAANDVLLGFWDFAFMPLPPWRDWAWFPGILHAFFAKQLGADTLLLALWFDLLLAAGILALWRRRGAFAAVYTLPFALTILASGLHLYPFADRLILFLTPPLYFLIAEGAAWFVGRIPSLRYRGAAWGLVALVCLLPFARLDWERIQWPYPREHMRPALQYIADHRQPGDAFYAYRTAFPTVEYYAAAYGIDPTQVTEGVYYGQFADTSLAELEALRQHERVWVIIARPYQTPTQNDEQAILDYLDQMGEQAEQYAQMGVSVYLYTFD
jgi:hypothetical protein